MSLFIKDVEMPDSCLNCRFRTTMLKNVLSPTMRTSAYVCLINGMEINNWYEAKHKDCPLVEIRAPHGRLIDADANVGSYVETWTCNCSEFGTQRVMAVDDLKYLSTIIEAEVSE